MVEYDSTSSLLTMMHQAKLSRVDGYHAYARVLLDWYIQGKFWTKIQDEDASVEELLLNALKLVEDANLRLRIEEALISKQRNQNTKP